MAVMVLPEVAWLVKVAELARARPCQRAQAASASAAGASPCVPQQLASRAVPQAAMPATMATTRRRWRCPPAPQRIWTRIWFRTPRWMRPPVRWPPSACCSP